MTELGPLILEEAIASGGMGTVYRARHTGHDRVVAVKTLHGVWSPAKEASFEREAAAVAALSHPHVVRLFEVGQLPSGEGRYLAMEWAEGGALDTFEPRSWEDARHVLDALLRGLICAHARGLVHRDIKLENLLLCGPLDDGPSTATIQGWRIALSDFGTTIADRDTEVVHAGTPQYMAPEQIVRCEAAFGPWTDLYQVGVLAWRMLHGVFPFTGDSLRNLLREHLIAPLPPWNPRFPVPDALEHQVRALLQKSPYRRPGSAAEVLEALWDGSPLPSTETPGRKTAWRPVPIPDTESRIPVHLDELGLGRLRLLDPVERGRTPTRQALWNHLRAVHEEGRPRCVHLIGAEGTRTRALARWCASALVDAGGGMVIPMDWNPLAPKLALEQAIDRVSLHAADPKLERHLPEDLQVLVAQERRDEPHLDTLIHTLLRLMQWIASHQVVLLLLRAPARDRVLDHWIESVVSFPARRLGLMVLRFQDGDGLDESCSREHRLIAPLASRDDQLDLIRWHVRLAPDVENEVVERAAGLPGRVVDILSDLAAMNALRPSRHGYAVVPGAWERVRASRTDWVRRCLRSAEPSVRRALVVAGCMGTEIDRRIWQAVVADDACVEGAESFLLVGGLARLTTPDGIQLTHPAVSTALASKATVAMWAAVARALEAAGSQPSSVARAWIEAGEPTRAFDRLVPSLRRATWLSDATGHARGFKLLRQALAEAGTRAGPRRVAEGAILQARYWFEQKELDPCTEALDSVPADAPVDLRVEADLVRGSVSLWQGHLQRAYDEVVPCFDADVDPSIRFRALIHASLAINMQDRGEEGLDVLRRAGSVLEEIPPGGNTPWVRSRHEADLEYNLGLTHRQLGHHAKALAHAVRAAELFQALGTHEWESHALVLVGEANRYLGDLGAARVAYRAALAAQRRSDGFAIPMLNLCLLALRDGHPEEAYESLLSRGAAVMAAPGIIGTYVRVVLLAAVGGLPEQHAQATAVWKDLAPRLDSALRPDADVRECLTLAEEGLRDAVPRVASAIRSWLEGPAAT
ncbi:MAG: serine/threonine-protein kinase [Myxococcota bacterium]